MSNPSPTMLLVTQKQLAAAAQRLEEARKHRDELIITASSQGMSRREVGEAVGLSAGRIQHIVNGAREGEPSDAQA